MGVVGKGNIQIGRFCQTLKNFIRRVLPRAAIASLITVSVAFLSLCVSSSSYADSGATDNYPSVTLWPLVYHHQQETRSRTDVFYPVFHYKREGTHRRFAIRPFLYNHEKDSERNFQQVNLIWPLTHFETEETRFKRYVFPFYYHSDDGSEFSFHLWPFYGHSLDVLGTETWSTIYPFFQYQRNETDGIRRYDYFWPLGRSVKTADRSSNYLFPFWWQKQTRKSSGLFLFPYLKHETESARRDAILPIWYRMRAQDEKRDFLLLWYAHEKQDYRFRILFPFHCDFEKGEERRLSLFLPFYGRYRNQANDYQTLFPFYFRHTNLTLESEFRYYFPFYGHYRKGDEIKHSYYLFPVYAHIEDETIGREAWYFLWPLVYRDSWPEHRQTWAIPLYWSKQTPEKKSRAILVPPYYSFEEKDGRKEVHFWPFYGLMQDQNYAERSVLWPLFRWGRDTSGERRAWQFLLAYRKVEPQRDMFGFFPLWHSDHKKDRVRNVSLLHWQEKAEAFQQFSLLHAANPDWSLFSVKNEEAKYHHHLFPFYSYTEQAPVGKKDLYVLGPIYRYRVENSAAVSHQFLWKILYSEKTAGTREAGFLWRLIRSKEDENGSLFEFNPFYYSETRSDGGRYTSWLGGIYAVKSGATGKKHTLFWGINW